MKIKYKVTFTQEDGIHTIVVKKAGLFGSVVGTGIDTRSHYALTKAFKGLFPKG